MQPLRRVRGLVSLLLLLLIGAGCSGPAPSPAVSLHQATPRSPAPAPPTAAPAPPDPLSTCPAARPLSALTSVHRFPVSPDDIAATPDGRLWVTARAADLVVELDASGAVLTTEHVSGGPEGVAVDGTTLYVAQQDVNSVVSVTSTTHRLVTFANRTANAGIDGIALDASSHRLLVPDSPIGEVYAVNLDGAPAPLLLGSGLGRPVAATPDGAGGIVVASESRPGLWSLPASGSAHPIGDSSNLDEVVRYGALLYVADLDHHDIVAVDPDTGRSAPVAMGLPSPQGLTVTSTGLLMIVDASTDTLYSTPACGIQSLKTAPPSPSM
ncbi:MAG: NHL repeat-containing protein [Candidatus Dormibacteria bacterium]